MNPARLLAMLLVSGLVLSRALEAEESSGTASAPLREEPRVVHAPDSRLGRLVPDLELERIGGGMLRLKDLRSQSAVVIAFTSTSCPVTRRYGPTLAALEREYAARNVGFVFVNPVETDSREDIEAAIRAHGLRGPYVQDAGGAIRAALDARSTAEAFVLDAARTLVYRGAIDDQYGLGYSRDRPSRSWLREALEAVLAGKKPGVRMTTAPACSLESLPAGPEAGGPPTYHGRVSRIVNDHCVECHRKGGVAPFSLETHADLAGHAGMVRRQVTLGAMPPWFASRTDGPSPWANDRSLPEADRADLLAWLDGGLKEGDPADAPLPRVFPEGWMIGEPDAVFRIPEPIEVKATGTMRYKNVFIETGFEEPRWVRSLQMRPTARDVVHHALVYAIPPDRLERARRRGGDGEAREFFAAYVPGSSSVTYPEGFGKLLPARSILHFQIHYTPNGTATTDRTELGLVFMDRPRHEVRVSAIAAPIDIPPGEPNYETRGAVPVPFDARILALMPHMHVRGKAFRYELESRSRDKTLLLDVPRYDFNWQLQYRFEEPIGVLAGSRLMGTAWFDNSAANPANPDPARRVKWGQQTDDEMMLGYFEYYVPSITPDGKKRSIVEMTLLDGGMAFNNLDRNRDGTVTEGEYSSPEEFRDTDSNGDGVVTREEFKAHLRGERPY